MILAAAIICLRIKSDPDKGCEQPLPGLWVLTGVETHRLESVVFSPGIASLGVHGGELLGFSVRSP